MTTRPRSWRTNLRMVWIAEFLALMGFSATAPIWPLYTQYLGVPEDQLARWSGIIISAPAFTMGFLAPIWGALSDRHGRKMMVMRAMFGGAVVIGLMALVTSVYQLVILRLVQGALTGTVAAATTLVASTTPKERLGETLGKLQLAVFLGQSLGPITGGLIADTLGYRATFTFTAIYLVIAGFVILTKVHEDFTPAPRAEGRNPLMQLRASAGLIMGSTLGLLLGLRFASRLGPGMCSPTLPLLVQQLLPVGSSLENSATGLLSTLSGISSAVAAPLVGRWADRHGGRGILFFATLLGGVVIQSQALSRSYWGLATVQLLQGVAVGGRLAILSSFIARVAPEGRTGTAFGLDSAAVSLSNAIGPSFGGWLADTYTLRTPFYIGGALMLLSSFGVFKLPQNMRNAERSATPAQSS